MGGLKILSQVDDLWSHLGMHGSTKLLNVLAKMKYFRIDNENVAQLIILADKVPPDKLSPVKIVSLATHFKNGLQNMHHI